MKRILLIGSAGAGKTTLAPKIAAKLGLPCLHLDQHFWQPGWVEPERPKWERQLRRMLKAKKWVMDGHYGGTQELRMKYADTVILLDINRWICLWRVLGRVIKSYGRTRPDMAPGCKEQFDWGFMLWIWNFPQNGRLAALKRMQGLKKSQKALILRSPAEVREFLESL